MGKVIDAAGTFFHHLADVHWLPLAIGLGFHALRLFARLPAWRNIVRASYPELKIPRRTIAGSYLSGIGVNAIIPARAGDALKLYLVHHRIEGTTYPTLGATLIVETLLDSVLAGGILAWALVIGVLPGLDVLPHLPQVDWSWPLRHKREAAIIGGVWLAVLILFAVIGIRRAREFKARVRQGFAVLRPLRRYLLQVASWQLLSWAFRLASVYFFLKAFQVPATLHNALLVLIVQSLSTLLPFTPGGVGTQQGLLVYVFDRAGTGVAGALLLSFSIGMYIAVLVANIVIGFAALFLTVGTLRWRRVVPDDEQAYARGP
ncbi:MAG TPA: lysylphosphatidylglycerol synthase transmembrane domain-containing protein [Gaiellaceae bacterium]|nr:lysylphosphatidylglycerol synthase transmembrane domain-containing protein [Gaiellaceae bacterium]